VSLPLSVNPEVDDEVIAAYDWYELQRPGLGGEFLNEVESVLGEIVANPARFGFAERSVREGLLNRFPYAIYYRVLSDRLRVLAVTHTHRDLSRWRSRR